MISIGPHKPPRTLSHIRTILQFNLLALYLFECLYCVVVSNNSNNLTVKFPTIRKTPVLRIVYRIVKRKNLVKSILLKVCLIVHNYSCVFGGSICVNCVLFCDNSTSLLLISSMLAVFLLAVSLLTPGKFH